jgi:hypothetical protein
MEKTYLSELIASQVAAKKFKKTGLHHWVEKTPAGWVVKEPEVSIDPGSDEPAFSGKSLVSDHAIKSKMIPTPKKKPIMPTVHAGIKPAMSAPYDPLKVTGAAAPTISGKPATMGEGAWSAEPTGHTYKWSGLPPGVEVSDDGMTISGVPTEPGVYKPTFTETKTGNTGKAKWSVQGNPPGVSIDDNGVLTIDPNAKTQVGSYLVGVKTVDKAPKAFTPQFYLFKVPFDMIVGETPEFYKYIDPDNPAGGLCYLAKTSVAFIAKDLVKQHWNMAIKTPALGKLKLWKYLDMVGTNSEAGHDVPVPSQFLIYQGVQQGKVNSPPLTEKG